LNLPVQISRAAPCAAASLFDAVKALDHINTPDPSSKRSQEADMTCALLPAHPVASTGLFGQQEMQLKRKDASTFNEVRLLRAYRLRSAAAKAQPNTTADQPLSALQISNLPFDVQQVMQKRIRLEPMPRLSQQVSSCSSRLELQWRASPTVAMLHQQQQTMQNHYSYKPFIPFDGSSTLLAMAARG
jgi:hypothetical protein